MASNVLFFTVLFFHLDFGRADVNQCFTNVGICRNGICINTVGSFTCLCHQGFRLSPDGKKCLDADECFNNTNICRNGICRNTEGSYKCFCNEGYKLSPRGDSCIDVRQGSCFEKSINGICKDPRSWNTTRPNCCCSRGEAWGNTEFCEICPKPDEAGFDLLCPDGNERVTDPPGGTKDRSPAFTKNTTCNEHPKMDISKDYIGLFVGIAVAFVILLTITSVISYCVGSHCHKKSPIYVDLTKEHKENSVQYTTIDENQRHSNLKKDESHYTIQHADETNTYPNSVASNIVNSSSETKTNNVSVNVLNEPYYFEPLTE